MLYVCPTINYKILDMKKIIFNFAFAGIAIFALASCSNDDDMLSMENASEQIEVSSKSATAPGDNTIAELVVGFKNGSPAEFTYLFAALEYTGLTSVFTGSNQYTVFAPTDQAFENLVTTLSSAPYNIPIGSEDPFGDIDAALGADTIKTVLLYHVTKGRRAANSVVPDEGEIKSIKTLAKASFNVNSDLSIDAIGSSADIIGPNNSASNGIIHVISEVLLPIAL